MHSQQVLENAAAATSEVGPTGAARVLLLTTQVYSTKGGIPVYMRRLTDVFTGYTRGAGKLACLALAGKDAEAETSVRHSGEFEFRAYESKAAFCVAATRTAFSMRPHIIIAGHLGLAPVAAAIRALAGARRYAIVLHGIEAWKQAEWKDRMAARRADVVVATTWYTADTFSSCNGVDSSRLRVVQLALGETSLPSPAEERSAGAPRILTVGRLSAAERYKGVDTLILAVAQLASAGNNVALDVAGCGDDMDRLKQLAEQAGVSHLVRFLGRVSDAALEELYARCSLFAMPSKGEGFGFVFLEAMRHGKACIGGNHGGTPEVIDDGVDGFLVEHGDVRRLAQHIAALAGDAELRERIGRKAQEKVRKQYLFDSFERNWRQVLDDMLNAEPAGSRAGLLQRS